MGRPWNLGPIEGQIVLIPDEYLGNLTQARVFDNSSLNQRINSAQKLVLPSESVFPIADRIG